jgi:uncharacterized Zn-binding protein involved in type VI secretion
MPGQARLGDTARARDSHGCSACRHRVSGPAVQGSTDVLVNGKPAVRCGDGGVHALCCGPNRWSAGSGSKTVFINGKPAFRQNDPTIHCGGSGKLIQSSGNVIVGNGQAAGFIKAAASHAPFVCDCNK